MSAFASPPDPERAGSVDEIVERLRLLKAWAGSPSFDTITGRVNAAWSVSGREADLVGRTTVVDCFRAGRRRLNADLVVAVVEALHADPGYVARWRQALRVVGGELQAAAQVRVSAALPEILPDFTARGSELERVRSAFGDGTRVCLVTGMAGAGKTQLAVRAGHLLAGENAFDHVLFVNLRGFHEDATQPPADPSAVLDGMLQKLGVPSLRVPYGMAARATALRERLAGRRVLLVLDNAADEEQVRPLLPDTPGSFALVTSRRHLPGLTRPMHLTVDAFTPAEALRFLGEVRPPVSLGPDPSAPARIARCCGYLPLALALVSGQLRATPDWTLTDHADRLDERRQDRRLDDAVELTLQVSYDHLGGCRRLLRLLALHPGQDFDGYAAAALAGTDPATVRLELEDLCRDHLLQPAGAGRYAFHDLVRAFAVNRAADQDAPSARRAALTRLFDYYLATAAVAVDALSPAEAHRRPRITASKSATPNLSDRDAALSWLDAERHTLVAVAAYTAVQGWPGHTTALSTTLFRYLNGGYHSDALTVHDHARHAAADIADPLAQGHALTNLGATFHRLGRYETATDLLRQALDLFAQVGDPGGRSRAANNLAIVLARVGRYEEAVELYQQAILSCREAGDRTGEPRAEGNLGNLEARMGKYESAIARHERAVVIFRETDDRNGEAHGLDDLGEAEISLGRLDTAAVHLRQALELFRGLGDLHGEAWTLDNVGTLHTHLGRLDVAAEHYRRALGIHRDTGEREGEASALNGLGVTAYLAGDPAQAVTHHAAAQSVADSIGDRYQLARACAGLGYAHEALGNLLPAREHYRQAMNLYAAYGSPEAGQLRTRLAAVDQHRTQSGSVGLVERLR